MLLGITIGMITYSTDHLGGKEKEKKNLPPLSWCSSQGGHRSECQVSEMGQTQGGDWLCPGLHRTCRELGHRQ